MSAAGLVVGGVAIGVGAIVARGIAMPRSQLWGKVLFRGNDCSRSQIALTFDDGPNPEATPAILEILRDMNVRATFFVIGRQAQAEPDILRRIHNEGHQVGNHSFDHARLGSFRGRKYWRRELERTNEVIQSITGVRPEVFRPPMGIKTPPIVEAARAQELAVVTWTRRALDGVGTSSERIINRLGRSVRAGDIVAMHDGCDRNSKRKLSASIEAVPPLIDCWRRAGLELVRLDALLATSSAHASQVE